MMFNFDFYWKKSRVESFIICFDPYVLLTMLTIGCVDGDNGSLGITQITATTNDSATMPKADSASKYKPVTIIDGLGGAVIFQSPPKRIVAYDSAAVEILFAIGEGQRIVGTHDFVEYPKEAANIKRLGGAFEINVETILKLEPDLVFLFSPTFLDDLSGAGVTVLYIPNRNRGLEGMTEDFLMWGAITGNLEAAQSLADDFTLRIEKIRNTLDQIGKGPKVFRDEGDLWTPGPNTLIGEAMTLLKLENIAYDINGFEQLSSEILIKRNPEIIIKTDFSNIETDPVFQSLSAIQNNKVFSLLGSQLSVAGPRFIQGIEELAQLIYPEQFN